MKFLFSPSPRGKSKLMKHEGKVTRQSFTWLHHYRFFTADGIQRTTACSRSPQQLPPLREQHNDETDSATEPVEKENRVSFSEGKSIKETLPLNEYTDEEYVNTFYSDEELESMLKRTFKVVEQIQSGDIDPRVCIRGLEKMSGERNQQCRDIRRKCVDAVMDEQAEQWTTGLDCAEKICRVAMQISREAAERGLKDAKYDVRAARSYLGNRTITTNSKSILQNRNDQKSSRMIGGDKPLSPRNSMTSTRRSLSGNNDRRQTSSRSGCASNSTDGRSSKRCSSQKGSGITGSSRRSSPSLNNVSSRSIRRSCSESCTSSPPQSENLLRNRPRTALDITQHMHGKTIELREENKISSHSRQHALENCGREREKRKNLTSSHKLKRKQ